MWIIVYVCSLKRDGAGFFSVHNCTLSNSGPNLSNFEGKLSNLGGKLSNPQLKLSNVILSTILFKLVNHSHDTLL